MHYNYWALGELVFYNKAVSTLVMVIYAQTKLTLPYNKTLKSCRWGFLYTRSECKAHFPRWNFFGHHELKFSYYKEQ